MPLIMVMLKFPLQSFHLSLNPNQFQIQIPLWLNQLMIMKWIISWNSSIQNMMTIFWMLISICFNLDWCCPLLQNFIQSLLCCFIKTEERMLQSQIACHTFICLSQPRQHWNLRMQTWDIPKELVLLYVSFLTVKLYTQLEQFIIVQVTLPTLYHQAP